MALDAARAAAHALRGVEGRGRCAQAPQFDECIATQETGLAMSQALRWPGVGLFAVSRRQITPVIELPAGSSGNFKPMCHSAVGLSAPRQL